MEGRTHAIGGMLAACAVAAAWQHAAERALHLGEAWPLFGAALIGSLLPDIDHPGSAFGRAVPVVSDAVSYLAGHRRGVHSLLAALAAGALAWAVGAWAAARGVPADPLLISAGLTAGYLSHLLLDALNPGGVPFFWPWGRRFGLPLTHVSGPLERLVVLPGLLVLAAVVAFAAFHKCVELPPELVAALKFAAGVAKAVAAGIAGY